MKWIALFLALVGSLHAAGSVNQSLAQIPGSTNYVFTENWIGDAITGSVPATVMLGTGAIQGFRIVAVEVAPGSPAPTNNYTVTITDFSGADVLGGAGASLSNSTAAVLPTLSNVPPLYGSLTVNVTGNSVASAKGSVLVYFSPVSQVFGATPVGAGLTNNNLFTGANTFNGATTVSGALTTTNTGTFQGNNTFSGTNSYSNTSTYTGQVNLSNVGGSGGIYYVCASPCLYTTLAAAVAPAVAAGGGIIYDTNPETFTSNPMAAVTTTAPVEVFFGHGKWLTNVQIDIPHWSSWRGMGQWNGSGGTAIQANAGTFPTQSITATTESGTTATYTVGSTTGISQNSMVSISGVTVAGYNQSCIASAVTATTVQCTIKASGLGNSSGGILSAAIVRLGRDTQSHGATIRDMSIDCINVAGCAGISSSDANEYSGARDIQILNFPSYGIDIESSTSGAAQNSNWENIEMYPGNGAVSTTQGFRQVGNGGGCPAKLQNINIVGVPAFPIGTGFFIANCVAGVFDDLHSEQTATGIQIGDAILGAVTGFIMRNPNSGPNLTGNAVSIQNNSTATFSIFSSRSTATNNIVDTPRGTTITDSTVGVYIVGGGALGSQEIYSTSNSVFKNIIGGPTFAGNVNFNNAQYFTETSSPGGASAKDMIYADSAAHAFRVSMNNGGTGPLVTAAPCTTSQKTETAADANLLTCAIPAQAGSYRIRFVLDVSAANAATLGWTATWTGSSGTSFTPTNLTEFQQNTAATNTTFTFSGATLLYGYADVDVNNAGTSIVVKLTFSGTSFTGKASATVERII